MVTHFVAAIGVLGLLTLAPGCCPRWHRPGYRPPGP